MTSRGSIVFCLSLGIAVEQLITGETAAKQFEVFQRLCDDFNVDLLPDHIMDFCCDSLKEVYEKQKKSCEFAPCKGRSVKQGTQECQMMSLYKVLKKRGKVTGVHPGTEVFPGDFHTTSKPQLVSAEMEVHSMMDDWHSTGFYAPADKTINVDVQGYTGKWEILIGAHTDKPGIKELRRWPDITMKVPLKAGDNLIHSDFGGLIFLVSPRGTSQIKLKLNDVVEAPHYDLRDPSLIQDWGRRRQAPGLWAVIAGKFVTLVLPSSSVRNVENPRKALEFWDQMIVCHFHLVGEEIQKRRRTFIVADEQPSAGYMHSGYPIVTHLDVVTPCDGREICR